MPLVLAGIQKTFSTYSKLSKLGIVDTEDFGLFGSAKAQARDQVHNKEDNAGSSERVRKTRNGIGNLVSVRL